ncbi:MAG: long-chain fatty acid--CoA ligase [Bdellovibrionaceae bacterium]|nr:long-chain fatty acid--CoA ligase [Pseudobdellovibrionaceae bacterium]
MKSLPITNHLLQVANRPQNCIAIKYKQKNIWRNLNWLEYLSMCEKSGSALIALGLEKGDKVAILSETRWEWEVTDMSILGCGGITVPLYQSQREEELEYILNDSQVKFLFCENIEQLKKWKKIKKNCPSVNKIILFEGESQPDVALPWEKFLAEGSNYLNNNQNAFKDSCLNIKLEDTATIIYTSGTTGQPKGVVLTHTQIMSEVEDLFTVLQVNEIDCTLTFLPFAHVLGRVEMWGHIYKGYTLAYAESIDRIKKNLLEVRPTLLIAVPRIFEKIYNGILAQVETNSVREKIFNWALDIGKEVSQRKMKKEPLPLLLITQYQLARKLVFDTIYEKLGGRLRFAFSGGAPLSQQVGEFFHATGLLILEGYGLTETTAAVCVNTPLYYRFGTVGKALGDVEIKLAEDGEILVKSNKVMKAYHNNTIETANVFTNGYFHTGDIGEFVSGEYLKITDRKKDLIKTAGGKYVAPQKLENLLKLSPYISNVLIHGDQRKYIVALVTLDEASVKSFALNKDISYSDVSALAHSEKIKELIREAVSEANSQLSSFESIKNFDILERDFTVESGELTPSLKVKRSICDKKYSDRINSLYGQDRSSL